MKNFEISSDDPRHWSKKIWLLSHDIPNNLVRLGNSLMAKEDKLFENILAEDLNDAICEAFASNLSDSYAIEGETLDSSAIKSSLIRQMDMDLPGWKINRENDREARAVAMTLSLLDDAPLSHDILCEAHSRLKDGDIWGRYRKGDEEEFIVDGNGNVIYKAPEPFLVKGQMDDLLEWWNDDRLNLPAQIGAAIGHYIFVAIHPFGDGNGRIARAITERGLVTEQNRRFRPYCLSSQILKNRSKYYKALSSSNPLDFPVFIMNMQGQAIEDAFKQASRLQFVRYFLQRGEFEDNEKAMIKTMALDERIAWTSNDFDWIDNAMDAWDNLCSRGIIDENGAFNKEWREIPRGKTTFMMMF